MLWDLVSTGLTHLSRNDIPGFVGAVFVIGSFNTRTMIKLRALSAAGNVCFMIYGLLSARYPTFFLHAVLLPVNLLRMWQMIGLVRRARASARGDHAMDWLRPFMTPRKCRRGEIIFRKGDVANALFYIDTGAFRLAEAGINCEQGMVVGELGMLSPVGQRTQTFECVESGQLFTIHYEEVRELFFQNPDFGFYFMQLAASRLFNSMERLERQLADRSRQDQTV